MTSHGFFGYVCDFDGFLPVLLCGNLAFVTLSNDLFDHGVHGWKPILSSYHLLCFGRSQMSEVVCSLNDLSLQASGDDDLIHTKE